MKGLTIGFGVFLLTAIVPAVRAQQPRPEDRVRRMILQSEAKHAVSRRNLNKILQTQPQFWLELQAMANRLNTQPAWLLNVLATESLFDPAARNRLPGQTASGLMQWVETTAQNLGTTTKAIRQMNSMEQLRLVEKYLAPFRGRLDSLANVYLAVFRGVVIEGGDAIVVAPLNNSKKEQRVYSLNKWLDLDGDKRITKGELALAALAVGRFQPVFPATQTDVTIPISTSAIPAYKAEPRQTRSIYIHSSGQPNQ